MRGASPARTGSTASGRNTTAPPGFFCGGWPRAPRLAHPYYGVFVASFKKPFDFINAERGLATSSGGVVGGGRTTYGALTAGVSLKPDAPKATDGFAIRPELYWDQPLNGTRPFVDGKQRH